MSSKYSFNIDIFVQKIIAVRNIPIMIWLTLRAFISYFSTLHCCYRSYFVPSRFLYLEFYASVLLFVLKYFIAFPTFGNGSDYFRIVKSLKTFVLQFVNRLRHCCLRFFDVRHENCRTNLYSSFFSENRIQEYPVENNVAELPSCR